MRRLLTTASRAAMRHLAENRLNPDLPHIPVKAKVLELIIVNSLSMISSYLLLL
jgi:hypothetical protein